MIQEMDLKHWSYLKRLLLMPHVIDWSVFVAGHLQQGVNLYGMTCQNAQIYSLCSVTCFFASMLASFSIDLIK